MNGCGLAIKGLVHKHSMSNSPHPFQTGPRLRQLGLLTAALLLLNAAARGAETALMPPPIAESTSEPIRYVGKDQPDKRFYDGALRHAVGVHKYQALRANRTCPPEGGAIGWTYNHQPYLAYWQNRFYLSFGVIRGRTIASHSAGGTQRGFAPPFGALQAFFGPFYCP